MGVDPQAEGRATAERDAFDHLRHAAEALLERDLQRALHAVCEAIDLDPRAPEGFRLRSRIRRLLGDYVSAARDWSVSLALDPHAALGDEIRGAAQRLRGALGSDSLVDKRWDASSVRATELRQILERRAAELERRRTVFVRPACPLPCPSYCCHFEHEPFVYGVGVEPAQLAAVKAFLAENRLEVSLYLGRTPASACTTLDAERLACLAVLEEGERYVCFPRRTTRCVADLAPRARPKTIDFQDLSWLNPHSRACAFVSARGCLIHDLGEPPGLAVCRGFLCLAAFVYLALETLGIVPRLGLQGAALEDLNDCAVAALLRLDARLLRDAEVLALQTEMRETLDAALDADARGAREQVAHAVGDHQVLEVEHAVLVASRHEEIRAVAFPAPH